MTGNIWQTCMLVDMGLTRSECASWVQAWGSGIAILASGLIAWVQIYVAKRSTMRAQRERALATVDAVAQLARSFSMQMASLAAQLDGDTGFDPTRKRGLNFDPFRTIEGAVQAVQLHDLPDTPSVKLMIEFRNLINTCDMALKRLIAMMEDPAQVFGITAAPLNHLVLAAQHNDEKWKELVVQLSPR
eukprot:TRINITY_DN2961_c0_g2_i1.p3 TRINITY_DN2961_c0_g2~~TRINITY_DN2961_c0_g2_i1.p3  ORF type:complete len:188 (-),score=25.48 TRINITY_DN2961_c0_g2_i1:530-1093(-)